MIPKKSTRIRKEEIILAAFDVAGKKGVRALTIATIAEAAGMSEANLYRHFGGKDDIFAALAEYIGRTVMGNAATIAAGSEKPLKKLERIFFSHIAIIAEHPGMPRFMFSEDVHLGSRSVADTLAMRIGNYVETLSGIIAAGMNENELNPELSPRETALTFLGMIQFTALRWTMGGEAFDIREEAKKLWSNFLRFIRWFFCP